MTPSEGERFSRRAIADALDEALAECAREPRTDLRASFWDRLLEGREMADSPAPVHRGKGKGHEHSEPLMPPYGDCMGKRP